MSDPTNVPPGWYQDPANPGRPRWWDGYRWTEHYAEPQYQPGTGVDVGLPQGTKTSTPWVWLIIAVVGVVTIVNVLLAFSSISAVLPLIVADARNPYASALLYSQPGYLVSLLLALLVYAFAVVAAWRDPSRLLALGVTRPFHWAWTFLNAWVYMVGRAVVLRRRGATDAMRPLIVWIVVEVVVFIVVIVIQISFVFSALGAVPGYR